MLGADALGPRDTIILGGRPPQLPGPRRQAHYGICKACGRSFTATPPRGKPPAMKALAVLLYALGNVSQGMIAKLLGVSHVAVYKWVRAAGEDTPAPSATPSSGIVQIDEMWHFVDGKKTRFGSGGPTTLWHGEPWPGSWVGVMMRPAGGCSTGSASRGTSS
jgi:hypothetical protein